MPPTRLNRSATKSAGVALSSGPCARKNSLPETRRAVPLIIRPVPPSGGTSVRMRAPRLRSASATSGRVEATKPVPRLIPRPSRLFSATSRPPQNEVAALMPRYRALRITVPRSSTSTIRTASPRPLPLSSARRTSRKNPSDRRRMRAASTRGSEAVTRSPGRSPISPRIKAASVL